MARLTLTAHHDNFPVRGRFTIARSSLAAIDVVTVTVSDGTHIGRGECRPYPRYGETVESVLAEIAEMHPATLADCAEFAPGAAANAVESAMVDYVCKRDGVRAWNLLGCPAPTPRTTAFTLSSDAPAEMAAAATEAAPYPLLKVKVGRDDPVAQFLSVAQARHDARFIVDANEALDPDGLVALAHACKGHDVVLIEQPLHADAHTTLPKLPAGSPPVCADESLHTLQDLPRLHAAGYRAVNVKLDKTGGPVRALELMREAKAQGFTVMAGCMVGTSLAMAPMVAISQIADVLDLDGPLLLSKDRDVALPYEGPKVGVPPRQLWG